MVNPCAPNIELLRHEEVLKRLAGLELADALQIKTFRCALSRLPTESIDMLTHSWALRGRPAQLAPVGPWLIWLFMGGRGSGKTRAGAEWVRLRVKAGARRIALIAPNYHDAREVMLEGESGLLNIGPNHARPVYYASRRRLVWPSGSIGQIFSGEDPDGLRGPQFDTAWADEFAAWARPDMTLANLRLGLRLTPGGILAKDKPRLMITTTPRPIKALRTLIQMQGVVQTRAATWDNANNLSADFISAMEASYGGSYLGRQELDGQLIDDPPGALWTRAMIRRAREKRIEILKSGRQADLTILALDPPVTSHMRSDACGIIIAARYLGEEGAPDDVLIIKDGSVQGLSPDRWARRAARLAGQFGADYILAETNQGGEMVGTIFSQVAPHIAVRRVHAAQSKLARAAPVALLYEQGRIAHGAAFAELEDELCRFGVSEPSLQGSNARSPDRADALIWAVHELLLRPRARPRIRRL